MLKKGTVWRFVYEELKNFNLVKDSFIETYLSHLTFGYPFYLQTGASELGRGAELFQ